MRFAVQAILFGNPFLLVVREEETMGEVKARIKAKLGVKDEDFETWKFAYVNNKASPVYYEDQDLVLSRFPVCVRRCLFLTLCWSGNG